MGSRAAVVPDTSIKGKKKRKKERRKEGKTNRESRTKHQREPSSSEREKKEKKKKKKKSLPYFSQIWGGEKVRKLCLGREGIEERSNAASGHLLSSQDEGGRTKGRERK